MIFQLGGSVKLCQGSQGIKGTYFELSENYIVPFCI